MAYETNSFDEKKDMKFDNNTTDKIEDVSTSSEHNDRLAELSAIEATAASKAAWLISITVSLGGLLFGMFEWLLTFEHHSNSTRL
jgi:SP family myo-inositol transporter-like MFS transporter 13